jgi:outer membrane protein assembly factor BamB
MIKAHTFKLFLFFFPFALYSCKDQPPPAPPAPTEPAEKIEVKKKEITYFSDSIDSAFFLESLDSSVAVINKLYFERDEENPQGIFTFRGGNQRNSPIRGVLNSRPKTIRKDWEFKTAIDSMNGNFGYWGGGAGWTGQPLVVNWNKNELAQLSGLKETFLNRNELKEIIQISLSGNIYFLDFESGIETRPHLSIRNPIKGTPSIDPKNKDLLYVGHGIPHRGEMAWRVFHLKKQTLLHEEFLPSSFAYRKWGACDASPLIDTTSSTMIWPTESGVIYRHNFSDNIFEKIEQFRYRLSASSYQGIESSPSAYKQLGYFTDNGGNVFCADLRTMKPRWHFFNIDDSDASPVISIENEIPFVFIGNEVDKQGAEGLGYLRKLNGLTGKEVWKFEKKCYSSHGEKVNNGGMLSTPLLGKEQAANIIYTIFSRTDTNAAGMLVAINKSNGSKLFEVPLSRYSWVSPIALYDKAGYPTLYVPTVNGLVFLIDGITGEVIFSQDMGCIFESSPIAWNNRIIQPARGNKIFSFVVE